MPRHDKAGRPAGVDEQTRQLIRMMLWRGDRQSDIAYWFHISPATVNGINKRYGKTQGMGTLDRWGAVMPIPPPGPYTLVQQGAYEELRGTVVACGARIEQLRVYEQIVEELTGLVAKYRERLAPQAAETARA